MLVKCAFRFLCECLSQVLSLDSSRTEHRNYIYQGKEISAEHLQTIALRFACSDEEHGAQHRPLTESRSTDDRFGPKSACEAALSNSRIIDAVLRHLPSLAPVLRAACVSRSWALAAERPALRVRADLSGPAAPLVRDHEVVRLLRRHGALLTDLDFTGCKCALLPASSCAAQDETTIYSKNDSDKLDSTSFPLRSA